MIFFVFVFAVVIIGCLIDKAEDNKELKAYNNGKCPKCGRYMHTIPDEYGNSIGFGCTNCGYKAPDRFIGSETSRYRKNNK